MSLAGTRISLICHPYVTRMYSYAIHMSLVCTCMSPACHLYAVFLWTLVKLPILKLSEMPLCYEKIQWIQCYAYIETVQINWLYKCKTGQIWNKIVIRFKHPCIQDSRNRLLVHSIFSVPFDTFFLFVYSRSVFVCFYFLIILLFFHFFFIIIIIFFSYFFYYSFDLWRYCTSSWYCHAVCWYYSLLVVSLWLYV